MEIKRNLKSLNSKTGRTITNKLSVMINNHDKYKKSYFWSPPGTASSRRSMEFKDNLIFNLGGKKYEIEQELYCSCKNVYWSNRIYIDGRKKTIIALKKLL